MTLALLIVVPLAAGILALVPGGGRETRARVLALAAMLFDLGVSAAIWLRHFSGARPPDAGWLEEFDVPWIPAWDARLHLALDGASLALVALTALLGVAAVLASWREVRRLVPGFHACLLWALGGITAVFLARDLLLFVLAWELMLVPVYLLIALWGHEGRARAAVRFLLFTQAGGLLLLAAVLGLALAHERATGMLTFDAERLAATPLAPGLALVLLIGFLAAFLVKLPAIPLHTWLPEAHTQAPTAGSIVLAGLLLKTGAYGLLRFAIPLFPGAAAAVAPALMAAAVAGIFYGSVLAIGQRDLKRFIAYTSVSHMGFVLLGLFAGNDLARQGALVQMVCHGLGTGGLFLVAGALQERLGSRSFERLGGLWDEAPRLGGATLLLALAALGLPGLGTFLGEFLVLLGTARSSLPAAAAGAAGLVLSAVASLVLVQRALFGPAPERPRVADLGAREAATLAVMCGLLLGIGLHPGPLLDAARHGLATIAAPGSAPQPEPAPQPPAPEGTP
ncbi:MAG TPA: NADH-quinone oxidoreductase subunit M [bacterium]